MAASVLIYDCEIVKCIPPKNGRLDPTLEYCSGWNDFKNMKISVFGFWSSIQDVDDGYGYVLPDALSEQNFKDYVTSIFARHAAVVGFKSKRFDDNLLRASGIPAKTTFDLHDEMLTAAHGRAWCPKGFKYGLDVIGSVNGIGGKVDSGELSPVLWQRGELTRVIDGNRRDLELTRKILGLGLTGHLVDPNTGKKLRLRKL
jgi:hypothetical protein